VTAVVATPRSPSTVSPVRPINGPLVVTLRVRTGT
jgi:hypothetical protein